MHRVRALAAATYGETTRRPLYYILLLSAAVMVYVSKTLSLFSFYQEMHLVREMGVATITFWCFLVVVITSGLVVTQELEDRTAVTLLSKPLRRSEFLIGKFAGLVAALVPGVVVLAGVLFITLYLMAESHLPVADPEIARGVREGRGAFSTAFSIAWEHFFLKQGGVVLEGALLSFLQATILAALSVSFSAFFPIVVSVAATALVFVIGNISGYMTASLDRSGLAPVSWAGHAAARLFPNLGYFNLQTYFSEGRIISLNYLGLAIVYAALYVSAVFLVSCSLFRRREVR
jgi:ABC-type transport system involved in multi-copper enzyme maturation permease subunit